MPIKSDVTKFFKDNAKRINPRTDPVAHNTNAGLLAMFEYLASKLSDIEHRVDSIEYELNQQPKR